MASQQRIWNPAGSEDGNEMVQGGVESKDTKQETIGFSIKNAVLFPPEVEKGRWPDDYSLSDHARLTVVFSPIRMPCFQLISWPLPASNEPLSLHLLTHNEAERSKCDMIYKWHHQMLFNRMILMFATSPLLTFKEFKGFLFLKRIM